MYQTLPQSLYLLCYTVDKEKFELTNLQGRGQLLRAAALSELVIDGSLNAKGRKVVRRPAKAPADSFAAAVLHDLPTEKPKGWLQFVHNKAHTAEKPVREQLAATGAITVTHEKRLGLVGIDKVSVNDPQEVLALRERVRSAVLGGSDPAAVAVDELTMAVFAYEVEVTSVFSGKERRENKQIFKELAARYDDLVPGLRKALRDSYLASVTVGGGWGQ
ncbi:GOLPH3/VPS74 family protein [Streptomyces tsukubensis]|uniref:GPP34 family phosphoprotein n=1 Tax=Streptomyces tsukubensis TaxID=83656 RepID=A0A1V4ABW3_9ACTN|nr:GPP34 family phosphoprotein [Streptomyces tsukubensis]OON81174.1 GPP34 family phosphoprotein [Streptomyces tsukubensis]QFR95713.1 GPP34 family phosphoprotein [Streptomyces tsukubensis]